MAIIFLINSSRMISSDESFVFTFRSSKLFDFFIRQELFLYACLIIPLCLILIDTASLIELYHYLNLLFRNAHNLSCLHCRLWRTNFGISPINLLWHLNGIHIGFTSESFSQMISTVLLTHLHTHLAFIGEM